MFSLSRSLHALLLAGALSVGLFAGACNDIPEWVEDLAHKKPGSGNTATGGCSGTGGAPNQTTCDYQGKPVPEGTSVVAADGCNRCTCQKGDWQCTLIACVPNPPAKQCDYQGKPVPEGTSVVAADGCNRCTCEKGDWQCTLLACVPPPPPPPANQCPWKDGRSYPEGTAINPDACTVCYCTAKEFACRTTCSTPPVPPAK